MDSVEKSIAGWAARASQNDGRLAMSEVSILPGAVSFSEFVLENVAVPETGRTLTARLNTSPVPLDVVVFAAVGGTGAVRWGMVLRPEADHLAQLFPALAGTPAEAMEVGGMALTLTGKAERFTSQELPEAALAFYREVYGSWSFTVAQDAGLTALVLLKLGPATEAGRIFRALGGTAEALPLTTDVQGGLLAFLRSPASVQPELKASDVSLAPGWAPGWLKAVRFDLVVQGGQASVRATHRLHDMDVKVTARLRDPAAFELAFPNLRLPALLSSVNEVAGNGGPSSDSVRLPSLPSFLPLPLADLELGDLKFHMPAPGSSAAVPLGFQGGVGFKGVSWGTLTGSTAGSKTTMVLPIPELQLGTLSLDRELGLKLYLELQSGDGGPGLTLRLEGNRKNWRPFGVDWLSPADLTFSGSIGSDGAGLLELTGDLGGRGAIPAEPFTLSIPVPAATGLAPAFRASLGGRSLEDLVKWVLTLFPAGALPGLPPPEEGLPWPAFVPFSLSDVSIPEVTFSYPIPLSATDPAGSPGAGASMGIAGKLKLPGLGGESFGGAFGKDGFRVDIPMGSSWQLPHVNWLALKNPKCSLYLGGQDPAVLAISGSETFGSRTVRISTRVPLAGHSGSGPAFGLAFEEEHPVLDFSMLGDLALGVLAKMTGQAGVALPELPEILDLKLQAPRLSVKPAEDGDRGGISLAGDLCINGVDWGFLKGVAGPNGIELGSVDLNDIEIVKGVSFPKTEYTMNLIFTLLKPGSAPFSMTLQATGKRALQNAFGIQGFTIDPHESDLSIDSAGNVTWKISGASKVIPSKEITVATTLRFGMTQPPAIVLEGGISSISLGDIVTLINTVVASAGGGSEALNTRGLPAIELRPLGKEDVAEDGLDPALARLVTLKVGTDGSFGFNGQLFVDGREWFKAHLDAGPTGIDIDCEPHPFTAGGVRFEDVALDAQVRAGQTPHLCFSGGVQFGSDVIRPGYSGKAVYSAEALSQYFEFDAKIEGKYDVGFRWTLNGEGVPGFDVVATLRGGGVDRIKNDLAEQMLAAARAAQEVVDGMVKTMDAAAGEAKKKAGELEDAKKAFRKMVGDAAGKLSDMAKLKERYLEIEKYKGYQHIPELKSDHDKLKRNYERAKSAYDAYTRKYGKGNVKSWIKAWKKKNLDSVLMEFEPMKSINDTLETLEGEARKVAEDLEKEKERVSGHLQFVQAATNLKRAASAITVTDARFSGSSSVFMGKGDGLTFSFTASVNKSKALPYCIPWGGDALVKLAELMLDNLK